MIRDLGDLGDTPNAGTAINDSGKITGCAAVPEGFRDSAGTGINHCGDVVGASHHLSGFIYRGKRMESLNALIDPKSGWNIQVPRAINDAGQIAASGLRNGVQYTVRLDLIRPHALGAPHLALDEDADATAH